MQSRGSLSVYIYYMYMVCTRVEPAIFEKREDSRRGSRGRGGGVPEGGIRPPWIIKIYISENKLHNISRFSALSGGNFVCLFKFFRLPSLTCYHIYLEWKYMYYDPSLPFNDFADCLGNFLVVHRSYTFFTCAEQLLFSAPEPKAQVHYCDHALSVVRPSLTFHIFDFSSETAEQNSTKRDRKQDLNVLYQVCVFRADQKNKMAALASDWLRHFRLLLWNRWTEFNETWQEARSKRPLPSLCFSGGSEKQDGRPGRWLAETFSTSPLKPLNGIQQNLTGSKISTSSTKFVFFGTIGKTRWPPWSLIGWDIFDLLWNRWIEFKETWQEARSQRPLPSLCFSGGSEKQDGRPGRWLADTFSTSPLKPLNGIQQNLTGSKISTSSTKFVFFGRIGKTRWPPWPLISWDIFAFSSEIAEQNSTKLDRKQDLNVLYQVFGFPADRKNKMAALASDWLRHFWLLLWNRWMEFNETWQEARSQRPLPHLCFSGRSKKQDGRPGLWLAETFSTSPLKPLNRIQRNLTGSKISTSSTKFVFLGLIGKTRGSPWLIPQKGGRLYSGARYVALWASCFLKPPTYIPAHSNLSESVKVRMCAQRIFKTVLNFLHFFKI